ncbi:hypothetical protein J6590_051876 [Homalodisca vitripennis]|nr:hypothetical protein J6590_051876 [Homalodisca vitripennis]
MLIQFCLCKVVGYPVNIVRRLLHSSERKANSVDCQVTDHDFVYCRLSCQHREEIAAWGLVWVWGKVVGYPVNIVRRLLHSSGRKANSVDCQVTDHEDFLACNRRPGGIRNYMKQSQSHRYYPTAN